MDLQNLPEGCIAHIISLTSPIDACRMSTISKGFNRAAESDVVWDKFLPPDTYTILAQSESPPAIKSKKGIYFALCNNPVLIRQGKMSFSLEKLSGKKCYMISARELYIEWGDTPHYWTWIPHPESRFEEVAELRAVCLLEICGKLDTLLLSPSTLYKAYLVFKFSEEEVYGFENLLTEVSVGLGGGVATKNTVVLHAENYFRDYGEANYDDEEEEVESSHSVGESDRGESDNDHSVAESDNNAKGVNDASEGENKYDQYQSRSGWQEIELGEFFREGGEGGELKMTFLEDVAGHWKCGLIVQGIAIRPERMMF